MGDSGVTVIMAASQAVDPGSTPGCRTESFFLLLRPLFSFVQRSLYFILKLFPA